MARGGRRAGTPGKSYGNRSDLNRPRPLPVTTATGQAYGAAVQQQQAQAAVPMAPGDLSSAPAPTSSPSHDDLVAQAAAYQPPPVTPLRAPSQRPGEPLMTPPQQPPAPPSPLLAATALLNSLGNAASPAVKALRKVTQAGQQNAGAP